jgi:hypothetical protein
MLKRIIEEFKWWREFGQTKRAMYCHANTGLVRELIKMGALRRVA